jgi:hypothetical protein
MCLVDGCGDIAMAGATSGWIPARGEEAWQRTSAKRLDGGEKARERLHNDDSEADQTKG